MPLTRVELERFTAFTHLNLEVSPSINVLMGANGTGKTHLMKVCYAACAVSRSRIPFAEKLVGVMQPSAGIPGRLVQRIVGNGMGTVTVHRGNTKLSATFSRRNRRLPPGDKDSERWRSKPIQSVYIPVKEMLANAPGFLSLYAAREIHFAEVYKHILDRAYLPKLRGPIDQGRKAGDNILFHSLHREAGNRDIVCSTTTRFQDVHPNLIGDAFTGLYDREVRRSLGGLA